MPRWALPTCATVALLAFGACGRWGFAAGTTGDGGTGDDDDGSGSGSNPDALPPLPPTLITTTLAAGSRADIQGIGYASDGTLAVTGGYLGTITLDGQSITQVAGSFGDAWGALIDADAHTQGVYSAGIDSFGQGRGISRDGTNLTSVGYFAGTMTNVENRNSGSGQDIFLTVATEGGALLASGNWGSGGNCQARQVASRNGHIVMLGTYVSTFNFGTGPLPDTNGQDNGFIASFPSDLSTPKVRTLNGASDAFPSAIDIGPDGSMCIAGRFSAPTDFGSGSQLPSNGSAAFIAKYDADLNYMWATAVGSDALAAGVAMLSDGSCVATGQFFTSFGSLTAVGNYDIWVGRFAAADGATTWLRGYGSVNADSGAAVAAIPGGGFLLSAIFNGASTAPMGMVTADGGNDGFIARFDDDGTPVTQELIGGTGDITYARGLAVSGDGSRIALGLAFSGNVTVAGLQASTVESSEAGVLFLPMLH
ncbi:MAG TPA: hypothetical protein VGM90_06210 [Kofleriaceae bacterium]